ncbi:hypothetical protein [Curtobacterium sp. MCBD17_040]|uniref:hypothetical protein n=1 Tax=Curtobacterium sp. MCBD17_040 TaxID=2175674 RepID=UPI000DA73B97|nr:hypothetical protein [Curtobacterium sp. MCBD17_040]WIB65713.1 hypothetical protein DEI94_16460 [Curtobacterium sp. MCBD17_040]
MSVLFDDVPAAPLLMPPTAGEWARANRGWVVTGVALLLALVYALASMYTFPIREQELATVRRGYTAELNRLSLAQSSFTSVLADFHSTHDQGAAVSAAISKDIHVRAALFSKPAVAAVHDADENLAGALTAPAGKPASATVPDPLPTLTGYRLATGTVSGKVRATQTATSSTRTAASGVTHARNTAITAMVHLGQAAANTGPGVLAADTLASPTSQQQFNAAVTAVGAATKTGSTSMTDAQIVALSDAVVNYNTAGKALNSSEKVGAAALKVAQAKAAAQKKADDASQKAAEASPSPTAPPSPTASPSATATPAPPVTDSPTSTPSPTATPTPTKPTVQTSADYQPQCTAGEAAFTQHADDGDTLTLSPGFSFTYTMTQADTGGWDVTVFHCQS